MSDLEKGTGEKEDKGLKARLLNFQLTKSWQYLLYIYLVLPGILCLLAWLFRGNGLGRSLAALYHTYNLFAVCPIPNFQSFTGVVGFCLAVWFLWKPLRRRDWLDLALSLALAAANFAFFYLQTPDGVNLNYLVLRYLSFQ